MTKSFNDPSPTGSGTTAVYATSSSSTPAAGAGSTKSNSDPDESLKKAHLCAQAAIDKKAENVKLLHLSQVSGFTDYFLICSAMSDRQVQAIADAISHQMKSSSHQLLSVEGYAEGRWVLMDFGDVVVHIFLDPLREYYDIERLWAHAPRVEIPAEFYGPGAAPA